MPYLSAIGMTFDKATGEISNYQCLSEEIRSMYFDIDTYNPDFLVEFFKWFDSKHQDYYWVAGYTNDEKVLEQAKLIHPVLEKALVLLKDSEKRFSIHVYTLFITVNMKRTKELNEFIRKYKFKVCFDLSVYNTRQLFRHPFFNKTYTFKKESQCAVDHGAKYHVKDKLAERTYYESHYAIIEYGKDENCINLLDIFKEMQEKGLFQFNPNDAMQSFIEEEKNKELLKEYQERQQKKEKVVEEFLELKQKLEKERQERQEREKRFAEALEKCKITKEETQKLLMSDQDSENKEKQFEILNSITTHDGYTVAMIFCIRQGAIPSWCKHDPKIKDNQGRTLEMICIHHGVEIPLWAYHDPALQDNNGYTAAMHFVQKNKQLPNDERLIHSPDIINIYGNNIMSLLLLVSPWGRQPKEMKK